MIKIENLNYCYRKRQPVFEDLNLTIEQGTIYGLLGKNGTGKSTLLYLITSLLKTQKGIVTFKGYDVAKRLPSVLKDIFIVPEEFELPAISLSKYVNYNKPFYPNFDDAALQKYLNCFEMDKDIQLNALSMGQKKKVFMSFALATNTALLVLDEPTNGLDIPSKSQFRKFITLGMSEEKTILISTHQVQDVNNLLEHIIILDDNRIVLNEAVSRICEKLAFVEGADGEKVDNALFSIPSLQGCSIVMPNTGGDETALNIEVLFQAVLNRKEQIASLFH